MVSAQGATSVEVGGSLARVSLVIGRARYAAQRGRFFAALETWDQLGDGRIPISDQHLKEVQAGLRDSLSSLFNSRKGLGICWVCETPRPATRSQYCSDLCGRRFRRHRKIQINGRWFALGVVV